MKAWPWLLMLAFLMQGCCSQEAIQRQVDISIQNAFNRYTDTNGLRFYTNGKVTDIQIEKLPIHASVMPRRLITVQLNGPEQEVITYRVAKERPCDIKVGDTVAVHGWLKLYEE